MRRCIQFGICSRHDETDDALQSHKKRKCITWTDPIARPGPGNGTREVEEIGESGPAEGFPQRGAVAQNYRKPRGRVDAEGVRGEIIDEPDQRNNRQTKPIVSATYKCRAIGIMQNPLT